MTDAEQRAAATSFSNYWKNKGDEKSDCQRFWIDFIQDVLGVENATQKVQFEKRVNVDGQTKFIDVYIPETRTLIEQKSQGVDLSKQYQQSGGWMATPFQQGRRYSQFLPFDEAARWIVVSNFQTFEIHDMNKPQDAPVVIALEELRHKLPLFDFMFMKEVKELSHEMEISVKAGEIVGILYDKLIKQYREQDEHAMKSLNALCVRLVFCLYAEDAGIFDGHSKFHDYLKDVPANGFRKALAELFEILDTKENERDKYLADDNPLLAAFPYVNGGLFADEDIEIPPFTDEIKEILLKKASEDFDWSDISPTIFGAVFESTLNPETRRSGGMHYTSIENIHKVIDPLFMDELNEEFEEIQKIDIERTKTAKLKAFQDKIAGLKFLDPACGSGNFLTETYISLRRLENKIINMLQHGQQVIGEAINPIKVSISQFYGIEINDFAVTVAKTALWIAEAQMMSETAEIVHMNLDFLPLKTNANITEGNALRIDWEDVVPKTELNYIMGNPPFVGARWMAQNQKDDVIFVFGEKWKNVGDLDYVCCWYKKCADFIENSDISCALVSTNSITQGAAVANLWKPIFDAGTHINYAYRTFRWDSEAKIKAHVHCVIVGFSADKKDRKKYIYQNDRVIEAKNINGYLIDADNIFIERQTSPICDVPEIFLGGQPLDDGNLILTVEEKEEMIKKEPHLEKFIRPYMMGKDFIDRKPRYCIWLVGVSPSEVRNYPQLMERIRKVQDFRSKSNREKTKKSADTPMVFTEIKVSDTDYIAIPKVSSEQRRYIPMDYISSDIIPGDKLFVFKNAELYHFGIMTSNVHMAWMRAVCGRLKSDYSYSNTIVYNNFPWCNPTDEQKNKIEQTARTILDARAFYPDSSLADLYDELTMPKELRDAHTANDKAVMKAYGFIKEENGKQRWYTEEECVAALMKMYQDLVSQ